ncbi:MAG: pyridoxamine 5'-phosphate oxidase family protein [Acidimicrobiales bacterium]
MSGDMNLEQMRRLLGAEHGLSVISLARPDGTVSSSVVNAGLIAHPINGVTTVAFVVRGSSYKRRRLRVDPRVGVTVRVGWQWQCVEGTAELIGPLDPHSNASVDVPALLRDIFRAAGGAHDDWEEYDRVMAAEQRTAVFVTPTRVYGNAG